MYKHYFEFGNICVKCKGCFCATCRDIRLREFNLSVSIPSKQAEAIDEKEIEYVNLLFPCYSQMMNI